MIKVACIILALNEEPRIEQCLKQFRQYVDFILILDGGSTDQTVKIAKQIADKVVIKSFSGSFAEEKNYARGLIPKDHGWILWADADERWDPGVLKMIKSFLREIKGKVGCFRFPRVNLPDGKDYPDYQIRLFPNSRDIEWRGKKHEIPYYVPENKPLDQLDSEERKKVIPVFTADKYPILHLPRRNIKREWWEKC